MNRPFVRSWVERDEVASTSDLARSLAAEPGRRYPLAVRARLQTQGRGRGSNAWWSDEGSLTITLVLDPAAHGLKEAHQPRTALAVAVAVVDAASPFVADPGCLGVRWPNDVEAAGKKVAGILPERVDTPEGPRLLIGLGVNVTTRLDAAPPEVRRMAASLHELVAGGTPRPDADAFLIAFLRHLPDAIERLAADDPALAARWAALDTLRGAPVRLDLGARKLEGVGRGIDPEGALLLEADGETRRLFGGRVLRDPA